MFKRFDPVEDVAGSQAMKSSAIRAVKKSITDLYPQIEDHIDDILPKKDAILEAKGKDKTTFITIQGKPLFFKFRDGPYFPTLRLLHQYPEMMTRVQVDRGAIKFVLKSADVMCPGLTSVGGNISADLPEGAPVAIFAEGKEHALGVGLLKMSGSDIHKINKGIGILNVHHLDDQLWTSPDFS